MVSAGVVIDRRQRRRQETIEEILDLAVEIMSEQGVAGLSLGEIARRMGIRSPSLYGYFASKTALYDALFARGARSILEEMQRAQERMDTFETLSESLLAGARALTAWCLAHPVYSQLLFWRPVPGFEPSPEAYAPAVGLVELSRRRFEDLQARGLLRADADIDTVIQHWVILSSGVISQQLANAPDEDVDTGRFTSALPGLVGMFAREYGAHTSPSRRKKVARADQR